MPATRSACPVPSRPDGFAIAIKFTGPAFRWPDDTTPRTDRPLKLYAYKLGAPCPHLVRLPVGFPR